MFVTIVALAALILVGYVIHKQDVRIGNLEVQRDNLLRRLGTPVPQPMPDQVKRADRDERVKLPSFPTAV